MTSDLISPEAGDTTMVTDDVWDLPGRFRHLYDLLISLFSTGEEFRRWMALLPHGRSLIRELPGESASTATTIYRGLEALRRHGYLDGAFFRDLAATFPRRRSEIRRAASVRGSLAAATLNSGLQMVRDFAARVAVTIAVESNILRSKVTLHIHLISAGPPPPPATTGEDRSGARRA